MLYLTRIIIFVIISSSCYSQKLKKHVHPLNGLEIGIPKGWTIQQHEGIDLLVEAPEYDKYYRRDGTILVYIRKAGYETTIDKMYEDFIISLETIGYEVNQIGVVNINNRRYFTYYTYKQSGKLFIKAIEYFTVKNNKIFTIRFSSFEQNFDELEPLFKRVVATLKY